MTRVASSMLNAIGVVAENVSAGEMPLLVFIVVSDARRFLRKL